MSWVFFSLLHSVYKPFLCLLLQRTNLFLPSPPVWIGFSLRYYIQYTNLFSAFSSSMSWVFLSLLHSVYQPFLCLLLQYELGFPLVITFSVPTFSLPSPPVWVGFSPCYYIQPANLFSALAFSSSMSWVFLSLLHTVYQPFLCPGFLLQYDLGFPLIITFSVPTFSLPWPSPPVWVGFSSRSAEARPAFPLWSDAEIGSDIPSPPGFSEYYASPLLKSVDRKEYNTWVKNTIQEYNTWA